MSINVKLENEVDFFPLFRNDIPHSANTSKCWRLWNENSNQKCIA